MSKRHLGNGDLKDKVREYVQNDCDTFTTADVKRAFCADVHDREINGIIRRLHSEGVIYRVKWDGGGKSLWKAY